MTSNDQILAMARAGQKLAVQWGHEPWSDSWAYHVADTMYTALEAAKAPEPRDYSYCENEAEAAAERAFDDSLGGDPEQDYRDAVAHYSR